MLAEYDGGGAMLSWWLVWDKLCCTGGDFRLIGSPEEPIVEPGGDFGKLFS